VLKWNFETVTFRKWVWAMIERMCRNRNMKNVGCSFLAKTWGLFNFERWLSLRFIGG